jgi:hypothetical protein
VLDLALDDVALEAIILGDQALLVILLSDVAPRAAEPE